MRAHTEEMARLRMPARKLVNSINRCERNIEQLTAELAEAEAALAAIWTAECERFGREIPQDAELLDVLALVVVEDGDVWRWTGPRNNTDIPVVRLRDISKSTEKTVVRRLAIGFGIIADDDYGSLYPVAGDKDDINPFHRRLRRAGAPTGNGNRYGFSLPEPAS